MYSHDVVTDSLGKSVPKIVTALRRDHFTRQVNLFPPKYDKGLGGIHLLVAASEIAPFVFRKFVNVSNYYEKILIRLSEALRRADFGIPPLPYYSECLLFLLLCLVTQP